MIPLYLKVKIDKRSEGYRQNSIEFQFLNLLYLETQKIHERMLFESAKLYNAFFKKFLYTYIFHVENIKIESSSLFVD